MKAGYFPPLTGIKASTPGLCAASELQIRSHPKAHVPCLRPTCADAELTQSETTGGGPHIAQGLNV